MQRSLAQRPLRERASRSGNHHWKNRFSIEEVITSCNDRSTSWPRPVSRARYTPARPQTHAIDDAEVQVLPSPRTDRLDRACPEMLEHAAQRRRRRGRSSANRRAVRCGRTASATPGRARVGPDEVARGRDRSRPGAPAAAVSMIEVGVLGQDDGSALASVVGVQVEPRVAACRRRTTSRGAHRGRPRPGRTCAGPRTRRTPGPPRRPPRPASCPANRPVSSVELDHPQPRPAALPPSPSPLHHVHHDGTALAAESRTPTIAQRRHRHGRAAPDRGRYNVGNSRGGNDQ